jgi:hypothetical protein
MDEARELYTVKEGKVTLREYVILANNKHRFEVKNRGQVLYEGESYQQAKSLYQELTEKMMKPAEKAVRVMSRQPKRRVLKLRTAYAEAS